MGNYMANNDGKIRRAWFDAALANPEANLADLVLIVAGKVPGIPINRIRELMPPRSAIRTSQERGVVRRASRLKGTGIPRKKSRERANAITAYVVSLIEKDTRATRHDVMVGIRARWKIGSSTLNLLLKRIPEYRRLPKGGTSNPERFRRSAAYMVLMAMSALARQNRPITIESIRRASGVKSTQDIKNAVSAWRRKVFRYPELPFRLGRLGPTRHQKGRELQKWVFVPIRSPFTRYRPRRSTRVT